MKLENIIKHLNEGADADIWYDADMYQDKRTAKQIAKTQKAMRVASNVLLNLQMAAKMRHGAMPVPLVGPKEPGPGKSDVIHMDDEGEGLSAEHTVAVANLLTVSRVSQEAEAKICDELEIRCPQPHLCTEGCAVVAWKTPKVCDTESQEGHDPRPFGASEEEVCAALDSLDAKQDHYHTKAYVTTATETLIEKLRDMEDLVTMLQSAMRDGVKPEFATLTRRIKWCKDDCMILRAKMKEPH